MFCKRMASVTKLAKAELAGEGWEITPAAVAALLPYIRERIKRFGEYATDGLIDPPDAFDPHLDLLPPTAA